jgi:hypothetical protein
VRCCVAFSEWLLVEQDGAPGAASSFSIAMGTAVAGVRSSEAVTGAE